MLGHKAFISFPPACLTLPKGVRATVYYNFLVSCQFALSILPFMWPCLGAREWPGTLLHFHPCDSLYHQYPNLPPFLLFSPPPHGLQVTFQWTCYVRVGLVLACHTEICVYSSAFLFYTTPGKHWHWNRSSSKSLARKCQWIKCTLLKIIFYRVIVSRHAAPLFCILGGKTQVCNINFLLKTT